MKDLLKRIAGFLSLELSERAGADALLTDSPEVRSRFDVVWDEALMASMSDESARWILDHCGPRCR
jgi:hypothetical protein